MDLLVGDAHHHADGVVLLLSFNSGGEEVFPKHCLVTTWSSCEEPTKQDDGVVLTWNAQVRGDPGPSIYTTGSPFCVLHATLLTVPQLAFNSGGEELFPVTV